MLGPSGNSASTKIVYRGKPKTLRRIFARPGTRSRLTMTAGPNDPWRERGLRDAALGGDAVAWRVLYDDAFEKVDGYVRWRCGGLAELSEDVVQETWMTAVKKLSAFDPHGGSFAL